MKSNKNLHLNRSNRKVRHDYSSPGLYFITSDIQNAENILGKIENNQIVLTEYGEIIKNEIIKLPEYHKRIVLDEWVIMPNHIHIIIILRDYDFDNGISNIGGVVGQIHEFDLHCTPEQYRLYRRNMHRIEPVEMIIPKIMGKFKMLTSKYINIIRNTSNRKNWQNYYYDSTIKIDVNYPAHSDLQCEGMKNAIAKVSQANAITKALILHKLKNGVSLDLDIIRRKLGIC